MWKVKFQVFAYGRGEEQEAERTAVRRLVTSDSLSALLGALAKKVPAQFEKGNIYISYTGEIDPEGL